MCSPNLDEMKIRLSECHKGHVSIIHPSEECPVCEALDKLDKREQELTEMSKDLGKAEESLSYYVEHEQELLEALDEMKRHQPKYA